MDWSGLEWTGLEYDYHWLVVTVMKSPVTWGVLASRCGVVGVISKTR